MAANHFTTFVGSVLIEKHLLLYAVIY